MRLNSPRVKEARHFAGPLFSSRTGQTKGVGAALITIALLAAINVLPFASGGADARILRPIQVLSFVTFLALTAFAHRRLAHLSNPLVGPLSLLIGGAILSTIFHPDRFSSILLLLDWLWLGTMAVLLFLAPSVHVFIRWAIVIALSTQVLWSFFVWTGGDGRFHQVGTFYAPNQFAGYIVLLAPIPLAQYLTTKSPWKIAWCSFISFFAYLAILSSGSRGGAAAGAAGLVACLFIVGRQEPRWTFVRLAALGLASVVLWAIFTSGLVLPGAAGYKPSPASALVQKKTSNPESLQMRIQWARAALELGLEKPITGHGLGSFGREFLRVQDPGSQWSAYVHNDYLEAFAEGGILLFLGALTLPVIALREGWKRLRESGSSKAWTAGIWAGLFGASLHMTVDHDWTYPAFALAFIAMAVLISTPQPNSE